MHKASEMRQQTYSCMKLMHVITFHICCIEILPQQQKCSVCSICERGVTEAFQIVIQQDAARSCKSLCSAAVSLQCTHVSFAHMSHTQLVVQSC